MAIKKRTKISPPTSMKLVQFSLIPRKAKTFWSAEGIGILSRWVFRGSVAPPPASLPLMQIFRELIENIMGKDDQLLHAPGACEGQNGHHGHELRNEGPGLLLNLSGRLNQANYSPDGHGD